MIKYELVQKEAESLYQRFSFFFVSLDVKIIEAEACVDHIHMLVSIPPHLSIAQFKGYLKGKSTFLRKKPAKTIVYPKKNGRGQVEDYNYSNVSKLIYAILTFRTYFDTLKTHIR